MAADGEAGETKALKRGGGMGQIGLLAGAIFLSVLTAQLAVPPLSRLLYGDPHAPGRTGSAEAAAEAGLAKVSAGEVDLSKLAPPIYVPLDPPLIVSIASADGVAHFLQMSLQAMARNQRAIDAIRAHAPALRNNFLFLVATHTLEDIATLEGKESLRARMRDEARTFLLRNTGDPGLEELYFTSFIVQ